MHHFFKKTSFFAQKQPKTPRKRAPATRAPQQNAHSRATATPNLFISIRHKLIYRAQALPSKQSNKTAHPFSHKRGTPPAGYARSNHKRHICRHNASRHSTRATQTPTQAGRAENKPHQQHTKSHTSRVIFYYKHHKQKFSARRELRARTTREY